MSVTSIASEPRSDAESGNPSARIVYCRVEPGHAMAQAIFQKKFHSAPPDVPHQLFALLLDQSGARVLSYVHYRPWGGVILVGGACTDGAVYRALPADLAAELSASGGPYFHLLQFGFAEFEAGVDAFFGYCGDARAEVVDLAAGFEKTGHEHLLVRWKPSLADSARAELLASVAAIGPF